MAGNVASETPAPRLPLLWSTFGARPIGLIVVPDEAFTDDELAELVALFPEASIKRRTYILDMPGTAMDR